ncbi:MAG: 16S rRNA (cytidine(1402)-2'-O)-methyltransferase [Bacteroidales bacterium]
MPHLLLIPTPIGNLEDITLRALRLLKEADLILAEDTRKTGMLLKHFGIENRLMPYHKFNEHRELQRMVERILQLEKVALVTDAGTPGISDPGFLLIRECIKNDITVECLPGPVAFVPALVNSGFPSDHFVFEGFLPVKKGRKTKLEQLKDLSYTFILYESPFRLVKTLQDLVSVLGPDRKACVSRELTKIYEENIRGSLAEIIEYYENKTVKGEIVLIIQGKD